MDAGESGDVLMATERNLALRPRDEAIYARRVAGATYHAIGGEFGLSHERVRQIVNSERRRSARERFYAPLRAAFAKGVGPLK